MWVISTGKVGEGDTQFPGLWKSQRQPKETYKVKK